MEEELQNPETILYETLSPLSLSDSVQSPVTDSNHLEPYSVYRNEISLSTLECPLVETTTIDFFSLDVATESSQRDSPPAALRTPVVEAEPKTPVRLSEPKLESGWFRGNCKFKSPMLQLHKGTKFTRFG